MTGRQVQIALGADVEILKAIVPTADDLALAKHKIEGGTIAGRNKFIVHIAIEALAIEEGAEVAHGDLLAGLEVFAAAFFGYDVVHTRFGLGGFYLVLFEVFI